ncbi:MAG: CAP domain-containing protein [Solirubrobacterales bacterium]|nr:CAP domain-containing protein [Solirubrobacterales bacterium]
MIRSPLRFGLIPALLVALLLALPTAASAASPCANADLMPTAENVNQVRSTVLCLLNVERKKRGMKALAESPQLRQAAQSFSRTMVRDNFFDHISPGGSTLLSRVRSGTAYLHDVGNFALGENIAWGTGDLATPRQTVKGWMNSAGHRHNILNRRFRHVGIGIAIGAPVDDHGMPGATYTTDFGYRAKR